MSARSYSSNGYYNYDAQIKSLLISGAYPQYAYVLSNDKTSLSCLGNQLFKFNSRIFSSVPIWSKKTSGSTSDNCGHLGLTFGRNEQFLYTISWFNLITLVTLFDTNGNSFWSLKTEGSNSVSSLITYKKIDSSKDLVLATSGAGVIKYNRIISST